MKKLTLGALAATIALGAMSPAFSHTRDADEVVFDLGYEVILGGSDYE